MRVKPVIVLLSLLATVCLSHAQVQDPPQWDATTSFVGGGLVRAGDGNFYRALRTNTNHDPRLDDHTFWELYYVRTSVVLNVATSGARFSSLQKAWSMLQGAMITAAASVLISIKAGTGTYTEAMSSALSLNHPCGSRIHISGDGINKVTLTFPGSSEGFTLGGEHSFGSITGLTIQSANQGSAGVDCFNGASLGGCQIRVSGFYRGIFVDDHSHVNAEGCTVQQFMVYGILAQNGSSITAPNCTVIGSGPSQGQVGVFGDGGTNINVNNGYVTECKFGYSVTHNSTMSAQSAFSETNGVGFEALDFSFMDCSHASANAAAVAYDCDEGGHMDARFATATGSTNTDFIPTPNQANALGSVIIH